MRKKHPNDYVVLLTGENFEGDVLGKAALGQMCSFESSGAVAIDKLGYAADVASIIAHEMGHSLGIEHDTEVCECPDESCIMAKSHSGISPTTHWSSCSVEQLKDFLRRNVMQCLKNQPSKLFDSSTCGNGFLEADEQCDCGPEEFCDNPCCDSKTCQLQANATCATGDCCDLSTCTPHPASNELIVKLFLVSFNVLFYQISDAVHLLMNVTYPNIVLDQKISVLKICLSEMRRSVQVEKHFAIKALVQHTMIDVGLFGEKMENLQICATETTKKEMNLATVAMIKITISF